MTGDFGRPVPMTFFGIDVDPVGLLDKKLTGRSDYTLTENERELRKTAHRLRVNIHNKLPVQLAAAPESGYARHLRFERYRYGPSRMATIDHELLSDHQALSLFGAAAQQVSAADRERLLAVVETDPYLTVKDKRNARNRIEQNRAFIEGTFLDLEKRIEAYAYAIDRTRIETPGVNTFAVEGSLNHLRDRAASLSYALSHAYEMALAAGGQADPLSLQPPYRDGAKDGDYAFK